jgi:DNA-binding NarL/FixJ family response regulator
VVLEATDATTRAQRERLGGAARSIATARGALRRRDPEAALEIWRGLVSGRWSLVERAQAGGATVLIAHRNEPRAPDPRGLSPRERAIVELVLDGASNKQVAYTLGSSHGTVASHLRRALRKLGFASRVDLMRVGALAAGQATRSRLGAGLDVVVLERGAPGWELPLTEAERAVALLVCEGLTNAQIAHRRGTAARTVANQLASTFGKLGVGSRAELALLMSRTSPSS